MNDRELLEDAAKSVDLVYDGYTENFFDPEEWLSTGLVVQSESGVSCYLWNPLRDDADAFRLMVDLDLKLYIQTDADKPYTIACDHEVGQYQAWANCEHGSDKRSATRRAIVMAAAQMVKT